MPRMFAKSLCVAAIMLLAPLAAATGANARVSINITFPSGSNLNSSRSVSCSQGARIIQDRGFYNVVQRDCSGRYFVYRASRRGWRYEITVRASDGRVVDYFRLRRL